MEISQFYNNGYEALFSGITAVILAQITKFFVHLIWKKQVDLRLFTTTGGMPGSHAAGVKGLSTTVGLICGWSSIEFAMSFGYALVVMYDAAGVRRAAGKQAACLNKILLDFYKHDIAQFGGRLKELLGHTPLQVVMGAIYGTVFTTLVHYYWGIICAG